MKKLERRWLVLGAALIVLASTRWGIGALAWVAPIPLLRYLRAAPPGWRARACLLGALVLAWTLATLKLVTAPLPAVAALGYGLPLGAFAFVPYVAWDALRRRADDARAVLAFPTLVVAAEWAQARLTPLGTWGAVANTQLDDLPLLQLASLVGIAGVGWVVSFAAAAIDRAVHAPAERARWAAAVAALVLSTHAFGSLRLALAHDGRTVRAAAVGTDATVGGLPLPSKDELDRYEATLFERTREAARAGAELVVWNEGSTVVLPEDEPAFRARVARLAAETKVELVVAYIAPISLAPLRYENEYVWFRPDGSVDHDYLKHEPVPGEPAVRGEGAPRVVDAAFGRASGAICYDYDFPYLGLRHARAKVDVVALPSSDWRGIDPFHTQMAALRAIEGGFSIVRSTRMGLSAGVDPWGRLRAWQSSFETKERVLYVTLPAERAPTLYSVVGDAPVWAGLAWVLALAASLARRRAAAAA